MKAKLLLRISAVLILVHLLCHTMGHLSWDKPQDPKMQEVVNTMFSYKAEFMGVMKSMADYFNGYSLIMFLVYAMSIAIVWIASGFINEHREIARRIMWPVALAYLASSVIEYIYFFPFAASISFGAGMLILLAVTVAKK